MAGGTSPISDMAGGWLYSSATPKPARIITTVQISSLIQHLLALWHVPVRCERLNFDHSFLSFWRPSKPSCAGNLDLVGEKWHALVWKVTRGMPHFAPLFSGQPT